MACLSVGRLLAAFEAWITGYRSEHYKLGLQMVSLCSQLLKGTAAEGAGMLGLAS